MPADDRDKEPSIFWGAVIGYAIAAVLGTALLFYLAINAGRASAGGGYKVLVGFGVIGAWLGYELTVRRRKALGVTGAHDEWSKFVGSWASAGVGMIIIVVSGVLALLVKLIYTAASGSSG